MPTQSKKNPTLVKLGDRLRAIRVEKGLSQERLAHLAGVYRNYIGIIERAEFNPTVLILLRICKALDIKIEDLVNDLE